jgi:hypothetical protein
MTSWQMTPIRKREPVSIVLESATKDVCFLVSILQVRAKSFPSGDFAGPGPVFGFREAVADSLDLVTERVGAETDGKDVRCDREPTRRQTDHSWVSEIRVSRLCRTCGTLVLAASRPEQDVTARCLASAGRTAWLVLSE